jgi:hypothetical protein
VHAMINPSRTIIVLTRKHRFIIIFFHHYS